MSRNRENMTIYNATVTLFGENKSHVILLKRRNYRLSYYSIIIPVGATSFSSSIPAIYIRFYLMPLSSVSSIIEIQV